tara:strand:+ start:163 stop:273 length:111 start_codon:yes stop_codon:yes gene_type:complete
LNLPAAGLVLNENGLIATDGYCQMSTPGIYAVGDVQ